TPNQEPSQLSTLTYGPAPGLQPLGPVVESDPRPKLEEGLGWFLEHDSTFTWKQDILILPDATPGEKTLPVIIKAQVCDRTCVIGEPHFEVRLAVSDAEPVALTPALEQRLKTKPLEPKVVSLPGAPAAAAAAPAPQRDLVPPPASGSENGSNGKRQAAATGLMAFIL